MMQELSITEGTIKTESGLISVRDLSYFLYHFRAVYVEALNYKKAHSIDNEPRTDNINMIAIEIAKHFAKTNNLHVSRNALANLPAAEELAIAHIFRRNPLDVIFSSVAVALAVAVIISGGEIEVSKNGIKVRLPPLGVGIEKLKQAIYGNKQNKAHKLPRTDD